MDVKDRADRNVMTTTVHIGRAAVQMKLSTHLAPATDASKTARYVTSAEGEVQVAHHESIFTGVQSWSIHSSGSGVLMATTGNGDDARHGGCDYDPTAHVV